MTGADKNLCLILCSVFFICGCTAAGTVQKKEIEQEKQALISVGRAVTGKELSDEQIKDLERKVMTDEETRSAVESISSAVEGSQPQANYCPIDGKRYAPNIRVCPEHNVELLPLE